MKSLNTKDFLESYKAVSLSRYPSLPTNEHIVLSVVLTTSIEFGLSFDEIQNKLDKMTENNILETLVN